MKILKESVSWSYFDKFKPINDEYLVSYGEGNTIAEQAVVAVNKLVYKYYNDGDFYDNTYNLPYYGNDLSSYANWLYKYAPKAAPILKKIENAYENDYQDILKELADLILNVDYLARLGDEKVDSIYTANGPFEVVDHDDEDDWY